MFDGGFIIGEQGIWVQSQKQGTKQTNVVILRLFYFFLPVVEKGRKC